MGTNRLMMALALLAEQSGESVSETRLEFMARKLMTLGPPDVLAEALERLLEKSRRFPTIAEVKAELGISDDFDLPAMFVENLIAAVCKYGSLQACNATGAKAIERAIGGDLWTVVEKMGGWNVVVERLGENTMAFRAQAKDAIKAYLESGVIHRTKPGHLPSHAKALEQARHEGPALPPTPPEEKTLRPVRFDAESLRRELGIPKPMQEEP